MLATMRKKKTDKSNRKGMTALQVWLPSSLATDLQEHIDTSRPRPTKTAVVVTALEEYLERRKARNDDE